MNSDILTKHYDVLAKFLNKELDVNVPCLDYYAKIAEWQEWYEGYLPNFHSVVTSNGLAVTKRDIYHLNMAKRVCEDWASALLAEPLEIKIEGDRNKSSIFVQGSKGDGGVLGTNDFSNVLSNALETAYALGTSAIVLGIENIAVDDSDNIVNNSDRSLSLQNYDALSILPISWDKNKITECAFISEITVRGEKYSLLNVHLSGSNGYVIMNYAVDADGKSLDSESVGIVPFLETYSQTPYFIILRPNIVNNVSKTTPLGVSIYANAIDNLKGCDICYDSCIREVITGQRIIFFNKMLLMTDESGKQIVPNDAKASYMSFFGEDCMSNVSEWIKEFHPTLNTDVLDKELQNQLNMLSMKCGLGAHYYNFTINGGITATEYVGERQDFQRNAIKNSGYLTSAVKTLIRAILSAGKQFLGANVNPESKIVVTAQDNVLADDITIREQDRIDVENGILSKAEYRAKWHNETIEAATKAIGAIGTTPQNTEE